jgi:hypothetical protein
MFISIISFPATVAGMYNIEVNLDGVLSFERTRYISPSIIDTSSVQIISASTSVVAGTEGQFSIRVQDVFGNRMCTSFEPCTEPPSPVFLLEHKTSSTVPGLATFDKVQSSFVCTYTATVAGTYTISLTMSDRAVVFRPTPYVDIVPHKANAPSFLFLLDPFYVVGTFSLSMKARDMFLNNISVGGESVQVRYKLYDTH